MCIRDRLKGVSLQVPEGGIVAILGGNGAGKTTTLRAVSNLCLLYTSDAADERSSVDLGGRRIIKKKKQVEAQHCLITTKKEQVREETR